MSRVDPVDPIDPRVDPIPIGPAWAFNTLDDELPLALFPVRLEARFLPDADPQEIVIRVFPDEIHADGHDPALTETEVVLARAYWETVWRAAAEPAATAEARSWLAARLGPHRAVYVASATRPDARTPTRPTPVGEPLVPPLELRKVPRRDKSRPAEARLLPVHWGAFVEQGDGTYGPFWAAEPVAAKLPVSPTLVELEPGADARDFLKAQGLDWTYDLAAAEAAGMVVRIPLSALPDPPEEGFERVLVLGVQAGTEHGTALGDLLAAHRYTRGLDLLPPGTATNATEEAPEGAGDVDVQALFEAEFGEPAAGSGSRQTRLPQRDLETAAELFTASPADAVSLAFGIAPGTALDLALAADDPAPRHAQAGNQALWPATWGKWFTDVMARVSKEAPLLAADDLEFLRDWFIDFVRADGPLPTLRVGRQPYGLLPVAGFERRAGASRHERMETFLYDLFESWLDMDTIPVLDPDSSDVAPGDDPAELASEVGAILGATPHVAQLRRRPVEDTHRELADLYDIRLGLAGLLCAIVPDDDGGYVPADELENHPWYQAFLEHEDDARGANGVAAQRAALHAMIDDLDAVSGDTHQEIAAFAVMRFLNKYEPHPRPDDDDWPDDDDLVTGDVLGMVNRHSGRVADAQPYLAELDVRDELGTDEAPRLYAGAYAEEGTELAVDVLVAPDDSDESIAELAAWLDEIRRDVGLFASQGPRPAYDHAIPVPLLRQLLQSAAATVALGGAHVLEQGIAGLLDVVEAKGAQAIPVLERIVRGTLGLAMYRVDAWVSSLASYRLATERVKSPTGLQIGGFGWLVGLRPRPGKVSQGYIHAPSIDHATTAAVLRSGWSAFGTGDGGSPLAVDLSSERVRAAKSLVEGVRSGQELGRLLGGRFERRLHDHGLDEHIDEIRRAVLDGAGQAGRPPTRIVDGLLIARAYTDGVERTDTESAVRSALNPIVSASGRIGQAVQATVADLDAVADVLFSQSVHSLLRGDAGVAAPTLAATGSGDSGLPAIDFPATLRGGRLVTLRVLATFGPEPEPSAWPGAAGSVLATAEPRLEGWVAEILGPPGKVAVEIADGGARRRVDLDVLGVGALDAVYGLDGLGERLLGGAGASDGASIVPGRPDWLDDDELGFDEFVALATTVRSLLGDIRPLARTDLETDTAAGHGWDEAELRARVSTVSALVPAHDPRLTQLEEHQQKYPDATAEQLIDRLHVLTVDRVPVLPLVEGGLPGTVHDSFAARQGRADRHSERLVAWLAQAAKVRRGVGALLTAVQMSELAQGRAHLAFALAQNPEVAKDPWVGLASPSGATAHAGWCVVNGAPRSGPLAGFVVDSWTETIPEGRQSTGIAVHFDRPSATAPNAVLMAVTRAGESFSLDYVRRCVGDALRLARLRAMSPDEPHAFLGHFLPATFLPGDADILGAQPDDPT